MKYLNDKYSQIIRVLLYFHRIIGITFGGLVITPEGRLTVNTFYKIYGYIPIGIIIVIHFYFAITSKFNNEDEFKFFGKKANLVPWLFYTMNLMQLTWKLLFMYVINRHGFKLIKITVDVLKDNIKTKINWKIIIIFLIRLTHILVLLVITIITMKLFVETSDDRIDKIRSVLRGLHYFFTFLYFWTIPAMTWVISIYCSDILDDIHKNLIRIYSRNNCKSVSIIN